ncbi:MAG: DUF6788 family protein [Solirubrobacteraceae bacterium]
MSERRLLALRRRLAAGVEDPALTLRGTLVSDMRHCSGEGCRCHRGELHGPYTYLTVYSEGRSRMVYVPKGVSDVAARYVQVAQHNELLLGEISHVNLELLKRRVLR